jgi:hypothetical protein
MPNMNEMPEEWLARLRRWARGETRRDREDRERAERDAIRNWETKASAGPSAWGPMGKPGPAGAGPTQSQDST